MLCIVENICVYSDEWTRHIYIYNVVICTRFRKMWRFFFIFSAALLEIFVRLTLEVDTLQICLSACVRIFFVWFVLPATRGWWDDIGSRDNERTRQLESDRTQKKKSKRTYWTGTDARHKMLEFFELGMRKGSYEGGGSAKVMVLFNWIPYRFKDSGHYFFLTFT